MGSSDGIINNCYAASSLPQALRHHGGLLDDNAGSVSNSFWDIERSRTERSDGGTGKTTAEMQDIVTFADKAWDIGAVAVGETDAAYVWNILPDETYPWLSWEEPVGIREIRTWHDLHAMRDNLDGSYVLMNDLDSATDGYAERAGPAANGGKGWEPIGDDGVAIDPRGRVLHVGLPFIGSFDGQGHRIRDLFIDRPDEHLVGLFGALEGSIKNVGIEDVAATGSVLVGGLAGGLIAGTVTNAYSTGSVSGDMAVGGLVGGVEQHGIVTNAHATCNVTGRAYVGGLVGANIGAVTHSHSGGGVTGDSGVGGLVGVNWDGTVNDSYSTATVAGETNAGGLVGENSGTVSNAFWDVEASGTEYSDGGTGKTAAEMKDLATFTDTATEGLDVPWDIVAVAPGEIDDAYVWNMVDGQTYPFLSWQSVS